ncbi:hypothetical protein [Streptomyces sp. CB01881]|uniref:hypothetical protein n=1 Tax=Streptomyces sp. CB01881 TaxID=2078691 RepID=UPI000CDCBB08|nr:hypothetical protein [Streptomyces sp. CB01881]AUY51402.1 hypothetical protein C2142_23495 [Streptomyces sp. CB01881]TYC74791.1 hypothetical protein EH183_23475 [Streptomyces sp. CB01881]
MDRHSFVQDAVKQAQESITAEAAQKLAEAPQETAPDLSAVKAQIGARYALPEILRDRLNGNSAEELEADAQKLAGHFRSHLHTMPTQLVKGAGASEPEPPKTFDPIALAKRILARRFMG